jgi:hypothetical protein
MTTRQVTFALCIAITSVWSQAQESFNETEDVQAAIRRVNEEIAQRRSEHERIRNPALNGGAFQPLDNLQDDLTIDTSDVPLGLSAQTYASLVEKEVLVSSHVSSIVVPVLVESVSKRDAVDAFDSALEKAGVSVLHISQDTLVLYRANE